MGIEMIKIFIVEFIYLYEDIMVRYLYKKEKNPQLVKVYCLCPIIL